MTTKPCPACARRTDNLQCLPCSNLYRRVSGRFIEAADLLRANEWATAVTVVEAMLEDMRLVRDTRPPKRESN